MSESSVDGVAGAAGAVRADEVEAMSELLEDLADAVLAREALAEPGEPVPWEQVKAEAGF